MYEMLKRRGVNEQTLKVCQEFKCDACEELRGKEPRPAMTTSGPTQPWEMVASNFCDWVHPTTYEKSKIFVAVDKNAKVSVACVWMTLGDQREENITADELLELVMDRRVAYYRRPQVLRADPERAWISKQLQDKLAD
jgi:hypothetical protein